MKRILTSLLVLSTFCLSSCSQPENIDQPAPAPRIILEISQDSEGMFDIIGKSLFARVYDDGKFEFEYPDANKKEDGINRIEDIKALQQVHINDADLKKLNDLLKNESLASINEDYHEKCCCTDTSLDLTIVFDTNGLTRTVAMKNFCDFGEATRSDRNQIPPKLAELLTFVAELRSRYRA